jgi:hypothetical protein
LDSNRRANRRRPEEEAGNAQRIGSKAQRDHAEETRRKEKENGRGTRCKYRLIMILY